MTQPNQSKSAQAIERELRYTARNYAPLPVVLETGHGEWLTDIDGKRYLDMMSAYSAVSHGHAHPRLVRVLTEQAHKVAVTSRAYHTAALGPLTERIAQLTGLDRVLPSSGGAESVETAIKAARRWGYRVKGIAPDQAEIVVARNNFHGRTTTIISFSTEDSYRDGFGPFTPGFRYFDFGDIQSLAAVITERTCAVLIEPIQGEAGIIVPPSGFLRQVRELCDRHHVQLIIDEIQSGLGRTGRWFAYEHEHVKPDGLILGKALGGGLLPVSCMVGTAALMDVLEPGSHGSTFGGNPLACAVALEALQVIEDEQLVERSAQLGAHLLARLSQIRSPLIKDVRGMGLWVGVDLDPAQVNTRAVVERLAEAGVLSKETHETVIRFAPPLSISRESLDWGVDTFIATLSAFESGHNTRSGRAVVAGEPATKARDTTDSTTKAQSSEQPLLMMCAPNYFEVSYCINPWMDPTQWHKNAQMLAKDARTGWAALKATYERLGAHVMVQPARPGLPDMVFTANAGVALDRKVVAARFAHEQRRGEEAHDRAFFAALIAQGVIDQVIEPPEDMVFEGAGDAIWDRTRSLLWTGWGQRSSRSASAFLAETFGVASVDLELVDPRFYHLDTCLCVLSGGEVLIHPAAFSKQGLGLIRELVKPEQLILAQEADALHLAVNSVSLGQDVVLCHASAPLSAQLRARGYRVHVVPLDSFNRSGGAAYCLTLRLDQSVHPRVPQSEGVTEFVEED